MSATIQINLPSETDQYATTVVDEKIAFVKIMQDSDANDPLYDYGNGKFYSFNQRHKHFIGNDKAELIRDLIENKEAVQLSYYEHSQVLWMVANSAVSHTPGVEFQWDGTRFASLWVPDKDVFANIGDVQGELRQQKLREYAESVCEEYTLFCNGNVFGYSIKIFSVQRDEDGDPVTDYSDYSCRHSQKAEEEDSCWGFYGWKTVLEEAESVVKSVLDPATAS